jgi:glycosyltransferase involved in cell wall biosynthesis
VREKLSAFVITHNRASLLKTCLRAASFADELIVVDKSSTDGSAEVASHYADRVEVVPWSPTVEATRAFALSLCRHDWILFLDDDEIISPETGPRLRQILTAPDAEIYAIPYRHYILGIHDERACYWPEVRHRLFRRGAIEFTPTVHGGVILKSDRIVTIPLSGDACIHHLSHPDVASFIERTNRYTAQPDRARSGGGEDDLIQYAHDRIDRWSSLSKDQSPDGYPAAVALLKAIYDIVDRLKTWEEARGLDGAALFQLAQNRLVGLDDGDETTRLARVGQADQPTNLPPSTGMTIPVLEVRCTTATTTACATSSA